MLTPVCLDESEPLPALVCDVDALDRREGASVRLPWLGRRAQQRHGLVVAWDGQTFAYVQAQREGHDRMHVQRFGVERQGSETPEVFARRLAGLGLKGQAAQAMLRPAQYQILQIEAPAVPPEELRTAARWQIREMVSQHMDDLTLDILKVGDEQMRASSMFVVAAPNVEIRSVMQTAQALRCTVGVIDIHDLAQRNLQSALARRLGFAAHAHAAVVMVSGSQALLTICANEELFYTRRIDLGEGFMQAAWGAETQSHDAVGSDRLLTTSGYEELDQARRLVVELRRSLDLWDRTWPALALNHMAVQAGVRTQEMVRWLGHELGHTVLPLDVSPLFPGFEGGSEEDSQLCWPLLGVLLRSENRKL